MKYLILVLCTSISLTTFADPGQPIELGKVNWIRNYQQALSKAARLNLPVLILFQEVPGCATCTTYGNKVLSHPLIVDLIQSQFIPIAIYNNKGGEDAKVLKKFGEPSWNNPVVRIINHKEKDIVPRLSGNYSSLGLVQSIKASLLERKSVVPDYLYVLEDELSAEQLNSEEVTYSMYCFWTGEKLFGNLNGVVKTRAGWSGGKEVVKVTYRPDLISKKQLDKIAVENSCRKELGIKKFKNDHQPKYYLSNSDYQYLPLSELQASKINCLIGSGENPFDLLSPTQQKWFLMVQKKGSDSFKNLVQVTLSEAWDKFQEELEKA